MPTITLEQLISRKKDHLNGLISRYNDAGEDLAQQRESDSPNSLEIDRLRAERSQLDTDIARVRGELRSLESDHAEDAEIERRQSEIHPTGADVPGREHISTIADGSARSAAGRGEWVRDDGTPAALMRGEAFGTHAIVRAETARRTSADSAVVGTHGSLSQFIRSISTSGASAVVPTVWSNEIIDKARAISSVLLAGATIVPMDAGTVKIGRITADPTAAFATEGGSITPTDPTLDSVTLTAKTMSALVMGSNEWLQDTPNADELLEMSIAGAFAAALDLAALYGGIESGAGAIDLASPPNPDGVLAALLAVSGAPNVLGATAGVTATNGTTITSSTPWNELLDLHYQVKKANEAPNAIIWSPRAAQKYSKLYASDYQPLRWPDVLTDVPRFETPQIPSYTQGSNTTATDVFTGDWTKLLIGQRLEMRVQFLQERYADYNSFGLLATWRGDVQLARPSAFAVHKAIAGA